jgi:hypothetical protein
MELIFYMFTAMPYVIAVLLGLVLPSLLLATYNHFVFGLGLVCVTLVLETLNMSQPFLRIGLTLFVPDLPMVLIGIAAVLRWLLRGDVLSRHPAWVLMALVFFIGLGLGLAQHGTAAGVQARGDYYAIAAGSYAMSFPVTTRDIRRMTTAFTAVALALIPICVYRWIVYYGDFRELLPPGGTYNVDGAIRVIGSGSALVIAQMLVVGLFFGAARLGARVAQLLSPLLLTAVLVLQHRSVWLASISGVLLSLMVARSARAPLWQQLVLTCAVLVSASAPLMLNQSLSGQLQSSASSAVTGQGTVNARFDNWRATLEQWAGDGPRAIVLGRTRGSDTRRMIETETGEMRSISFAAHNHYVSTLTGIGVLGFGALLWIIFHVVSGLWRQLSQEDEDSPTSALLFVLIGMQLVYYVAYGADYMQYLILGLGISWVAGHRPTESSVAGQGPTVSSPRAGSA